MIVPDAVERDLVGRRSVVGVGVGAELLPSVLAARERTDGGTWRLRCPADVVAELGRAFVLGTAVAEACDSGRIELRVAPSPAAPRRLFATDETVLALVGPEGDRTVLTESDPGVVTAVESAATERFEASEPATVAMPGRTRLIETARSRIGPRFAEDLASVVSTADPGAFGRATPASDRVLLLALGARHDHLFATVREWADDVGIAGRQTFTEPRRLLVDEGLVESVKVPMGVGHPNYRLRAADETLVHGTAAEVVGVLRDRLAEGIPSELDRKAGNTRETTDPHAIDTPVWERRE